MSIFHTKHTYEKQLLVNVTKKTLFLTKDEKKKTCPKMFIFQAWQVVDKASEKKPQLSNQ